MGRYLGKTCRLLSMLFVASGFFLLSLITGLVTNSLAVVTESVHTFSHIIAFLVALATAQIAKRPSRKNTFGWVRAEILGALVNTVFLLALCFSILVESLKRLVAVEEIERPILLLAVGTAGLVVNVIGLFLFHNPAHGHSHGGGGSHSHRAGGVGDEGEAKVLMVPKETENTITASTTAVAIELADNPAVKTYSSSQMNMKGVYLHVLGDALGSVVIVISSLIIWKAEGQWRFYVDPAMSIAMVIIVLVATVPLLKQTTSVLTLTVPDSMDLNTLKLKLEEVDGVLGAHELHVWQLTGDRLELTAHILCNNMQDYMEIAAKVKYLFQREGIYSTTVQPELIQNTDEACQECQLACLSTDCVRSTCCGATLQAQRRTQPGRGQHSPHNLSVTSLPDCVADSLSCQQQTAGRQRIHTHSAQDGR